MVNATITDRDLCAARALLRWTQTDLAEQAKVPIVYIRRFERGAAMKDQHLEDIIDTLSKAGVVFFGKASIDGGNVIGGVALKGSAKPKPPFEKRIYPARPEDGARTAPGAARISARGNSDVKVREQSIGAPRRPKA